MELTSRFVASAIILLFIYLAIDIENGRSELADIVLNEEQERFFKEAENFNGKRAVIADLGQNSLIKPWTNGIIPYEMDPKINGKLYAVRCILICTYIVQIKMLPCMVLVRFYSYYRHSV